MKMEQAQSMNTNLEGKDFTIQAGPKVYRVLSDQLYSNKKRAFIRELCSNANDIHIEVGTKRPFEIYVPTSKFPFVKIRDFGTGLTPDQMYDIYTSFFKSTRDNSNDFTGCFGLGTKSPLAYTDSFTIKSYIGGKKYIYKIYRQDWIPKISLLLEEPSDKPNGLSIKIPVQNDYHSFLDEIIGVVSAYPRNRRPRVYSWSEIDEKTVLINNTYWKKRDEKKSIILREYDEFKIYKSTGWQDSRSYPYNVRLIQGSVAYPAPTEKSISATLNSLKNVFNGLVYIDIEFPLGSIEITPSREEIAMTEESIIRVRDRINLVKERVEKFKEKKLKDDLDYFFNSDPSEYTWHDMTSFIDKYRKHLRMFYNSHETENMIFSVLWEKLILRKLKYEFGWIDGFYKLRRTTTYGSTFKKECFLRQYYMGKLPTRQELSDILKENLKEYIKDYSNLGPYERNDAINAFRVKSALTESINLIKNKEFPYNCSRQTGIPIVAEVIRKLEINEYQLNKYFGNLIVNHDDKNTFDKLIEYLKIFADVYHVHKIKELQRKNKEYEDKFYKTLYKIILSWDRADDPIKFIVEGNKRLLQYRLKDYICKKKSLGLYVIDSYDQSVDPKFIYDRHIIEDLRSDPEFIKLSLSYGQEVAKIAAVDSEDNNEKLEVESDNKIKSMTNPKVLTYKASDDPNKVTCGVSDKIKTSRTWRDLDDVLNSKQPTYLILLHRNNMELDLSSFHYYIFRTDLKNFMALDAAHNNFNIIFVSKGDYNKNKVILSKLPLYEKRLTYLFEEYKKLDHYSFDVIENFGHYIGYIRNLYEYISYEVIKNRSAKLTRLYSAFYNILNPTRLDKMVSKRQGYYSNDRLKILFYDKKSGLDRFMAMIMSHYISYQDKRNRPDKIKRINLAKEFKRFIGSIPIKESRGCLPDILSLIRERRNKKFTPEILEIIKKLESGEMEVVYDVNKRN